MNQEKFFDKFVIVIVFNFLIILQQWTCYQFMEGITKIIFINYIARNVSQYIHCSRSIERAWKMCKIPSNFLQFIVQDKLMEWSNCIFLVICGVLRVGIGFFFNLVMISYGVGGATLMFNNDPITWRATCQFCYLLLLCFVSLNDTSDLKAYKQIPCSVEVCAHDKTLDAMFPLYLLSISLYHWNIINSILKFLLLDINAFITVIQYNKITPEPITCPWLLAACQR